ncbi:MAG: trypsin-like serine protease [Alteromonadales bacterium]|nr:trypsin-like serine protease [Alteromonadales bacterium]
MIKYSTALIPLLLLNNSFSIANEDTISTRIVGGQESVEGNWPWMVNVSVGGSFCGGTLIDKSIVLTAAHCLFDSNYNQLSISDVLLSVGEYNKQANPTTPITSIYIHSDYDPTDSTSSNDIALLRLASPITNITPISLLDITTTTNAISLESYATAIGWGSTVGYNPGQTVTPAYPDILREVEVPLQTDDICAQNLDSYNSTTMICAGETGKDACQGDSGGPLVYNDGGSWKQIGIVSWGSGCASAGNPGVYTRLANYSDWIEDTITNLSIDSQLLFPYTEVNETSQQTLVITNNSTQQAQVSISIDNTENFSISPEQCFISAYASCSLSITYAPTSSQKSEATLTISSDLSDATDINYSFSAKPLTDISDIANQANFANSNVEWFTGGDNTWALKTDTAIIQSLDISNNQEAIILAKVTGKGRLNFDWAVSSERSFDYLSLIINGIELDEISGSTAFESKAYYLDQDVNEVMWRYKKDGLESVGFDRGSLTKVTFETMSKLEFDAQIAAETDVSDIIDDTIDEVIDNVIESITPSKSGGGGGSLLFTILLPLLFVRRIFK